MWSMMMAVFFLMPMWTSMLLMWAIHLSTDQALKWFHALLVFNVSLTGCISKCRIWFILLIQKSQNTLVITSSSTSQRHVSSVSCDAFDCSKQITSSWYWTQICRLVVIQVQVMFQVDSIMHIVHSKCLLSSPLAWSYWILIVNPVLYWRSMSEPADIQAKLEA